MSTAPFFETATLDVLERVAAIVVKRPARLALSRSESAEALGVSLHFFEEHIFGELRIVYRGRRRLIPIAELERWLAENATRVPVSETRSRRGSPMASGFAEARASRGPVSRVPGGRRAV